MEKIVLRKTKRLLEGHLWVFSNELLESPKGFEPGALVELQGMRGEFLGVGYVNPHTLIAARLLSRKRVDIDGDFFRGRIERALALRERFLKGRSACRAVYSEADFLPGLVVDKYAGALAVQFLTAGMDVRKNAIIEVLDGVFRPDLIVVRNDSRARLLEGLPLYKEVVKGSLEKLPVIEEDVLRFEVNPYEGQKTGFFLDQSSNRTFFKGLIEGGKGLDLFSYAGAWGVHLAARGARVACVDESAKALDFARRNAELNGLEGNMDFLQADVFEFLKDEAGTGEGRYDFIVLDPPAFVKSARRLKEAEKAYRLLNALCMRLLKPGGLLATSSCSYHMGREMFLDMLGMAGKEAGRIPRLLALRSQALDHPVLLSMPETLYLKCAFLLVD
jgi:23S rRNA (cytosine1962-C5)-methyltransferase